jgi:hypothetical protein
MKGEEERGGEKMIGIEGEGEEGYLICGKNQ